MLEFDNNMKLSSENPVILLAYSILSMFKETVSQ